MEHQVIVTLGDVWDELREQKEILNTIVARLDRMGDASDNQAKTLADHEKRVRELERRVWALPSVATILAVASFVYQIVRR